MALDLFQSRQFHELVHRLGFDAVNLFVLNPFLFNLTQDGVPGVAGSSRLSPGSEQHHVVLCRESGFFDLVQVQSQEFCSLVAFLLFAEQFGKHEKEDGFGRTGRRFHRHVGSSKLPTVFPVACKGESERLIHRLGEEPFTIEAFHLGQHRLKVLRVLNILRVAIFAPGVEGIHHFLPLSANMLPIELASRFVALHKGWLRRLSRFVFDPPWNSSETDPLELTHQDFLEPFLGQRRRALRTGDGDNPWSTRRTRTAAFARSFGVV